MTVIGVNIERIELYLKEVIRLGGTDLLVTPGSPVRVTLAEAGEAVVLTVADQGLGFSTEHITKVGAYMQFDRKLHEQQGLGLGLAICKRLTELHGGVLTIQSKRGAGASVVVKLPRVKAV